MKNLRKYGKLVMLITLIVIILLNFLPVHYTLRLFVGSFGFGSGFVLWMIGKNDKYQL
jgi:hypothetical protein